MLNVFSNPFTSYVHLKVPLNYISNPSISSDDKTFEKKLKDDQYDLSGKNYKLQSW
jgi:hypothetical protein